MVFDAAGFIEITARQLRDGTISHEHAAQRLIDVADILRADAVIPKSTMTLEEFGVCVMDPWLKRLADEVSPIPA